ncbi:MAG: hypothetical protein KKB90_01315 [Actinobacteria bacterium]|nr:hypothetical protein [Actinomycetota bacterium]MCG2817603.1 hypothetical protein [Actinomycetes bacterium]MBU4178413.1 hypothetical protein [Actinomycetota bacterium]MBU4217587.1 hypothetical protein [Actinomycetota bacterium]MBU4358086.1 hypothetical protein [Actinomycetota bacterium]
MSVERAYSVPWYRRAAGAVSRFFRSPLQSVYAPPMTQPGDWFGASGVVLFAISIFALPWITVGAEAMGYKVYETNYGLFVSPWVWVMVAVLVVAVAGLWFVQTRGAVVLGAGIFCLIFSVVFYIGAWKKINAIIGDVVSLARKVPLVGELLGDVILGLTKNMLTVHVAPGYWLLIPAGILLVVGGAIRMAHQPGWDGGTKQ